MTPARRDVARSLSHEWRCTCSGGLRDKHWDMSDQIERHVDLDTARKKARYASKTFGIPAMNLVDLVQAVLRHDALAARQWVADAERANLIWEAVPAPKLDPRSLAVAAGLAELLAARSGSRAPTWSLRIGAVPGGFVATPTLLKFPRSRKLAEENGPEPLRRRGILAPENFLEVR
jgi:hypothetical protein